MRKIEDSKEKRERAEDQDLPTWCFVPLDFCAKVSSVPVINEQKEKEKK